MSYIFDAGETKDPERTISLTLQTLGSERVLRVLPELFAVWEGHRTFIANELVLLEFVECFDALHALKLVDPEFVVEQYCDGMLSPGAVHWMIGPFTEWFKKNQNMRDTLFGALAAYEASEQLLEFARACGVSRGVLAKETETNSNGPDELVEALEAAAEFVDTE